MIEGDPKKILHMIEEEEKRAKDNISRHYRGKLKDYSRFMEKRKAEKKGIMERYYSSIAENAEGYMKREYEYVKLYEDYKVLVSAFNEQWAVLEKSIAEKPDDYARFSLARFQEILGSPDAAIVSDIFHSYFKYKVTTEVDKKPMALRIFKGRTYADFSPAFIKELIMPIYADRAIGGE